MLIASPLTDERNVKPFAEILTSVTWIVESTSQSQRSFGIKTVFREQKHIIQKKGIFQDEQIRKSRARNFEPSVNLESTIVNLLQDQRLCICQGRV
jgi:hypothetical protein